ncbi:MAG: FlgD immunoglobulin-like domain containing protein [bacterium]
MSPVRNSSAFAREVDNSVPGRWLRARRLLSMGWLVLSLSVWWLPSSLVAAVLDIPGLNGEVLALTVFEGDLVVGGSFTLAGEIPANRIARWDGESWSPLGDGFAGDRLYQDSRGNSLIIKPRIEALAVYAGELYAGGSFSLADGAVCHSIARWDGATWQPLDPGISNTVSIYQLHVYYHFPPLVSALQVYDGALIVGGTIGKIGEVTASAIARWDGSEWTGLGSGMGSSLPPRVLALASANDTLHAGGDFFAADYRACGRIGRWDGLDWHRFDDTIPDWPVTAVHVFRDQVLIGGAFGAVGDRDLRHLARWTGTGWEPLGSGPPNPVFSLLTHRGRLHAGSFSWDGVDWINALQTNGPVKALVEYDGHLVAGGLFSRCGGQVCSNLTAWTDTTSVVASLAFFTARRLGDAAVVRWRLSGWPSDPSIALYRQEPGQEREWLGQTLNVRNAGNGESFYRDLQAPATAAEYWLRLGNGEGSEADFSESSAWFGPAHLTPRAMPGPGVVLAPNRPNPFNPSTTFEFAAETPQRLRLVIYDASGRQVALLHDGMVNAGWQRVVWDGRGDDGRAVASGVYFARLQADTVTRIRKIVLAR